MSPLASTFCSLSVSPSSVSVPGDETYTAQNSQHWSGTTILSPCLIFTPSSTSELSAGLQHLVSTNTPFAVRNGGHMPNNSWSSVDNGVMISMEKFAGIEYDTATEVAKIGAGLRWKDVFASMAKYGRAVNGGTNGAPSVGGLTLGGGIGYYHNRLGYTANGVVNFEVVLSSGKVVNANASENPDLFWALRGGGNNLGIVTQLDFTTVPTESGVWAGTMIFVGAAYNPAIEAMNEFINNHSHDEDVSITFTSRPGMLVAVMFHDGDAAGKRPEAFERFKKIGPMVDTVALTTVAEMGKKSAESSPNGLRRYFNTLTVKKDTQLLSTLIQQYEQGLQRENLGAQVEGFAPHFAVMTLTHNFLEKSKHGPAAVSDPNGDELICIVQLSTWRNASDDELVHAATEKITQELQATAENQGALNPFIFMNHAGVKQDVFGGYRKENVDKLREVAGRYDPDGVFQTLLKGGFKLGFLKEAPVARLYAPDAIFETLLKGGFEAGLREETVCV